MLPPTAATTETVINQHMFILTRTFSAKQMYIPRMPNYYSGTVRYR